ncbi:hypothetical protein ERJ75_000784400 [Trypanosoma vivax]|uniref:Uncharacterized protein n=1 Tax=Trypanosoma vivax (strain Y486) TaxID=1055687 RepID=G0TWC8_TRYVY|nr:hypothetical protein TRVL_09607 [Trypanosoma vivax]KAH8613474.1 hypothetical protein ERJ75_000784400 [Trypanosoma vivax]CCC48266.1 conserved hypothetical protein [Trypanosoma vivax Y486]
MSQTLEQLLPLLVNHLAGSLSDDSSTRLNGGVKGDRSDIRLKTANVAHVEACESSSDHAHLASNTLASPSCFGDNVCESSSCSGAIANKHVGCSSIGASDYRVQCSYARWRRCIDIWRNLLGSDTLFLALLFHSGSLWASECPKTEQGDHTFLESDGVEGRSWSDSVLCFLGIREETTNECNSTSEFCFNTGRSGRLSYNRSGGPLSDSGAKVMRAEKASACDAHLGDESVQRVATGFLIEWFAKVDSCGKEFARAYYFSCALKIVALVENTTLIESVAHLNNLVSHDPCFWSHAASFCSILCCLLVEEARQFRHQVSMLLLPPPFFMLNFNLIGSGSRLGVWLPTTPTEAAAAGSQIKGEFYSCEVCSSGVMLRLPHGSLASGEGGDLVLALRLLDEAYVGSRDTLPLAPNTQLFQTKGDNLSGKTMGTRRRQNVPCTISSSLGTEHPPPQRYWSAMRKETHGYVHLDLVRPRSLANMTPSSTAPTGNTGRRRMQQQQGILITVPLQRGSRNIAMRDPLVAIVFALETIAKRLIGCRGVFFSHQKLNSESTLKTGTGDENGPPNGTTQVEGHKKTLQESKHKTQWEHSFLNFGNREEELECLVECALVLLLEALLLSCALSAEVLPHIDEWSVELVSGIVDLALSTPWPVVRNFRTAGYALCLIHSGQQHQALLIAIGLFATLTQRQHNNEEQQHAEECKEKRREHSKKDQFDKTPIGRSGTGWWEVFKASVLNDENISSNLCSVMSKLIHRTEKADSSSTKAKKNSNMETKEAEEQNTNKRNEATHDKRKEVQISWNEQTTRATQTTNEETTSTNKKDNTKNISRAKKLYKKIQKAKEAKIQDKVKIEQKFKNVIAKLWWEIEQTKVKKIAL